METTDLSRCDRSMNYLDFLRKVEGSIAAPLMLNGQLHGIFGIAKPVPYEFTPEEEETLIKIKEAISGKIAS
ncbi:hypothetical protein [Nostoc sp. ChiQUE01b]|uniref:hypothetical protein n=1 Tax=Nostoc sp. ChiQUE01b TaxID=3075376 RepID=UPI002AD24BDF|nr:hypothetical protein [Nostoc sp. ChiQUE01b]MDZ8263400.1 hypothetical protein [Nostoc sp. ChiQUE01b]